MSNLRLLHYNNIHVHYYLTGCFKIKIIKNDVYTKVYFQGLLVFELKYL